MCLARERLQCLHTGFQIHNEVRILIIKNRKGFLLNYQEGNPRLIQGVTTKKSAIGKGPMQNGQTKSWSACSTISLKE